MQKTLKKMCDVHHDTDCEPSTSSPGDQSRSNSSEPYLESLGGDDRERNRENGRNCPGEPRTQEEIGRQALSLRVVENICLFFDEAGRRSPRIGSKGGEKKILGALSVSFWVTERLWRITLFSELVRWGKNTTTLGWVHLHSRGQALGNLETPTGGRHAVPMPAQARGAFCTWHER